MLAYVAVRIGADIWVPTLQSPGEPERAGEARRADSASERKAIKRAEAEAKV